MTSRFLNEHNISKRKLYLAFVRWRTKDTTMAPFNIEMMNTLKEICKKLEIKHKFEEKWEK